MKHNLTEVEVFELHDAINADPEYKRRYEEIYRKADKEQHDLYREFQKVYTKKLFNKELLYK